MRGNVNISLKLYVKEQMLVFEMYDKKFLLHFHNFSFFLRLNSWPLDGMGVRVERKQCCENRFICTLMNGVQTVHSTQTLELYTLEHMYAGVAINKHYC